MREFGPLTHSLSLFKIDSESEMWRELENIERYSRFT